MASFATGFFDFNNDGFDDLLVGGQGGLPLSELYADMTGRPMPQSVIDIHEYHWGYFNGALTSLFLNNGDGTFSDISNKTKVALGTAVMGLALPDLDNDGWKDIVFGTGNPGIRTLRPNVILRNDDGKIFQDITTSSGMGHLQKGHGVSVADVDNDGDLEILNSMGGLVPGDGFFDAFFLNPGHGNSWIKIYFTGVESNRIGMMNRIKAVVREDETTREIYSTNNAGASYGTSTVSRNEIGLGQASLIETLEINWPLPTGHAKRTQVFENVPVNSTIRITQGQSDYEVVDLPSFEFDTEELVAAAGDGGCSCH